MHARVARYFMAIAQHGSMRDAAEALHVAQSALSRSVMNAEMELGMAMLERRPRGVVLTEAGEIFLRFRRPGADPGIRGMGLGLYLCRHLITAQHGRIWAESEGLGQGTTISFALPVAAGWGDGDA